MHLPVCNLLFTKWSFWYVPVNDCILRIYFISNYNKSRAYEGRVHMSQGLGGGGGTCYPESEANKSQDPA